MVGGARAQSTNGSGEVAVWAARPTLAGLAAMPVPPADIDDDRLRGLLRAARAKAHPDRNGGDRVGWDAVEDAAHALGLR